ncbi:zinc finger BED domain-containing protein RICESLEEPER 2-like [Cucumis melo var. makuwa]|uniref:Zinc finger BED domain-containing protein RICESLEEPER 2-like n=1 Tax=Cucumis melo var. makuwa TaxID=1194695 RepID=A0A5A7UUH9_CUCMM|nr:zinc finger BED domain-containing protein RICESLEEPER 2-like [Cucumis melo var. makuwa]TYK27147.1 zinc finger BED domain-containing protein RICESLEEPER 2-like [Cucumis melo var. makuwa]
MENSKACVKQEKIQCKALVCLDVATRWNSIYLMLEHPIKFENAFKILKEKKEDSNFVEYFEEDDCGNKRLGPLNRSSYVTSNVGYKEIDYVLGLNKWSNNNNYVLGLMAMNMKTKFHKYWGSLEKMNKLMFVAMVIDPCSTQIGHSTNDFKQSNNVTMEVENDEEVDPWITFYALREQESSMEVENDLTSYLSDKDVVNKEKFDIMHWWKMMGGRILDFFRSFLTPRKVETLICTQNWIRSSSVLLDLHLELEELETYENIETGNPSSSIILD